MSSVVLNHNIIQLLKSSFIYLNFNKIIWFLERDFVSITYTQKIKNEARHMMIKQAVKTLTIDRNSSACVDPYYVRNIYEQFISLEEGRVYDQANKIDIDYIIEWERQRNVQIGSKKPEDLSVCYLSGPEPQNDFRELISMGILPQNIWAFEIDNKTYSQALNAYATSDFKQPRILKMSIEKYFEFTPKKFDIVYIDACGAFVSDKHALRCISTLFKYHRLNSPGVLLTNFSEIKSSDASERAIYVDMLSKYFLIKKIPKVCLSNENNLKFNEIDNHIVEQFNENFDYHYGEFITSIICDIASVSVPNIRFANSNYWNCFMERLPTWTDFINIDDFNSISNNSLYKFFMCNSFLKDAGSSDIGISKIEKLSIEMTGITPKSIDLLRSLGVIHNIKEGKNPLKQTNELLAYLDSDSMYQFLDKPNKNLFLDLAINQFSYPMHHVTHSADRITYKAKDTKMYMDLMVFDDCRYIYEWLPAVNQIKNAFQNLSWQYVFRFAVDGLVKQRLKYNNEFFFQGSVISKEINGFKEQHIKERKNL